MDEAIRVAPLIEPLIRGGIPATFAGTGQQIPDDLEEVNSGRLARAVWASASECRRRRRKVRQDSGGVRRGL
jgi:flagellar biosynthesis GTPase FlhF